MGVILAIGNAIWEHEVGTRFQVYLPWDEAVDSAFFSGFLSFWSYIIILNTVVPISLYVRCVFSARALRLSVCQVCVLCPWLSPGAQGLPCQLLHEDEILDKEYGVLSILWPFNVSCLFFSPVSWLWVIVG